MPNLHALKVHPQFWDGLADGSKLFELRRNDRKYKVDDLLLMMQFDPTLGYSYDEPMQFVVTYILYSEDCPGLELGFVILGIKRFVEE